MAGLLVAMIAVVPWIARNWIVTGELVVGSSWNARSALHGLRNAVQPEFGSHPREVDDATIAETDAAMARVLGPIDSARKEMSEDRLPRGGRSRSCSAIPWRGRRPSRSASSVPSI
jgi:hypothetical protein